MPPSKLNTLPFLLNAIGEANIWDQIKKVCRASGSYFGLVHAAGTSLLVYRKDWAEEKGLKPPKTWDDLLVNAKALTMDRTGDGKIDVHEFEVREPAAWRLAAVHRRR